MHFVDLTPYTYCAEEGAPPALNVGWLDIAEPYERGSVPPAFIERLKGLLRQHHAQTRGFQECQFCPDLRTAFLPGKPFDRKLYEDCLADGRFSSAEIRVRGEDGKWYAAPRMIVHYVEAHGYRPPEEFIKAVMKETQ